MLHGAMSAAALGASGLQSLWSYNRENFMFDIPLRQSREFQEQNINISRFGLFREDIRDLAALTIDKVENYLIVNTLKLNFMVTVFFNFDRTDEEFDSGDSVIGMQLQLLFTLLMCTAFFWLLTSIWFSMHAVVLAQTFATKMLVQVLRFPLPSSLQIDTAAPTAQSFERNISDAFRVPLLSRAGSSSSSSASEGPCQTRGSQPAQQAQPGFARSASACPERSTRDVSSRVISVGDLVDGMLQGADVERVEMASTVEPHIKFFTLLKTSWAPFDLYGCITMEIGTAALMSGLGFYSLWYFRVKGADKEEFRIQVSGWFTFFLMTLIAWWSLILDLDVPRWALILLFVLMLAGPCLLLTAQVMYGAISHRVVASVYAIQALWVLLLCGSGITTCWSWPRWWRITAFLNVLHKEEFPPAYNHDAPDPVGGQGDISSDEDGSISSKSESPLSSELDQLEGSRCLGTATAAQTELAIGGPLLHCLDAILALDALSQAMQESVRRARDRLYEACRAAGVPLIGARSSVSVGGFRLRLPYAKTGVRSYWISPSGADHFEPEDAVELTLEDVLAAARSTADELMSNAYRWTSRDVDRLEKYGDDPLRGPKSFLGQFRRSGTRSKQAVGVGARKAYVAGFAVMAFVWLSGVAWSFTVSRNRSQKMNGSDPPLRPLVAALEGIRLLFEVPQWLGPSSLGCDDGGNRLLLADTVGAILMRTNGSERLGPLEVCGGSATLAADFGPRGALWVACPDGLHELRVPPWPQPPELTRSFPPAPQGLEALALDSSPPAGGGDGLGGLALLGGQLLALEADPRAGWRLAGSVRHPTGRNFSTIALRAGLAVALDTEGSLFVFNTSTGIWYGPRRMLANLTWRGLCVTGDVPAAWLALGSPAEAPGGGRLQLWRFLWQGGPLPAGGRPNAITSPEL